jgi:hypothetical protein
MLSKLRPFIDPRTLAHFAEFRAITENWYLIYDDTYLEGEGGGEGEGEGEG